MPPVTDKFIHPSDALLQDTPKPLNWVSDEVGTIIISSGSLSIIDSVIWQPLESSISNSYSPEYKFSIKEVFPVNSFGPVQVYENGGKSPSIETLIYPLFSPKHSIWKPL